MAVGRKCTVCNHKQKTEINEEIGKGTSLRTIADRFKIKSHTNVLRHTQDCLHVDLGAIQQFTKEEARATVLSEITLLFERTKKLYEDGMTYLSDPYDPFKFILDPYSHEIEVVYYDQNDTYGTDNPRPKRKKAPLSTLLAMLQLGPAQYWDDEMMREAVWREVEDEPEPARMFATVWEKAQRYFMHTRQSLDLEAEKVSIKHMDIRKFTLEATDKLKGVLDMLAKVEGIYKADQPNNPKAAALDAVKTLVSMTGMTEKEAMEHILHQQRETNMMLVDPAVMRELARDNGIMELEGIQ